MSQADAVAFLDRVETDEDFASELESLRADPETVHARVVAAGFDASPEEIREAFVDRYGSELTHEQLDQIAAGMDTVDAVLTALSVVAAASVAAF